MMKKIKNKRSANIFIFLLSLVVIVVTFVFLDQAQIVENAPGYYIQPFSVVLTLLVAFVIIGLITAITFYLTPRFHVSTITILIIIAFTLFYAGVVFNVITQPEIQNITMKMLDGTMENVILTHTLKEKLFALGLATVNYTFILFITLVLPNQRRFSNYVKAFAFLIIGGGLVALVYSGVKEFTIYEEIIKDGFGGKVPQSFVGNRNPYASLLLTSELLLLLMYYLNINKKRRYIYIILALPFVVGIHFTFSKTNTVLAYLLILFLFYRHLFTLIKRSLPRFIIELLLSTALFTIFFVFRFHPNVSATPLATVLNNLFPGKIFESGRRTFKARVDLWAQAYNLTIATPRTALIGSGVYLSRKYYFTAMKFSTLGYGVTGFGDYHNGFVEVMHTFGFVGLGVYVVVFVLLLIVLARRLKTDRSLAFYALISLIVFALRSQTESLVLLSIKTEGVIASLAFVLPFLLLMNRSHKLGYSPNLIKKKSAK